MTYSHMGTPTLPSAQLRFTSEFGMGSGGATMLWSPDKNLYTTSTDGGSVLIRMERIRPISKAE